MAGAKVAAATKSPTPAELPFVGDDVPLQTYIDLWVVRHGDGWVRLTEEMLIDNKGVLGRMTNALAQADLLEHHYIDSDKVFVAKLKKGA